MSFASLEAFVSKSLTTRWLAVGQADADPAELRHAARELSEKVQSLLAVAGLPHTPWLLVILLENEGSPDASVAAKNGDVGHLYQAVITARLSKSEFRAFNLNGKFTYLAELAYHLYRHNKPTLNDQEAREFHRAYSGSDRFDLQFDYEKIRNDFVESRILRLDGETISFRHDYVFSFFIAWWLNRNIHKDDARAEVRELCKRLHHDVSANVLVFLAHLTDNPAVLEQMLTAARNLFGNEDPATMSAELHPLNVLQGVDAFFSLPPATPEVNRRLLQEAKDEEAARQEPRSHDGRAIVCVPDEAVDGGAPEGELREGEISAAEFHRRLREIRASLRTIGILGQILRNKAQSAESPERTLLMTEVLRVGRRLLGHVYRHLDKLPMLVRNVQMRLFRVLARVEIEERAAEAAAGQQAAAEGAPSTLTRLQLREIHNEAKTLARRYWFDLYWMASFSVVKRLAQAVGLKDLDGTIAKVRGKDDALVNHLVQLASRLNRRGRAIPADELVRLHKELKGSNNKVSRVVLEALTTERLHLFDTDPGQRQQVCTQMGIKVPKATLDPARKKFGLPPPKP